MDINEDKKSMLRKLMHDALDEQESRYLPHDPKVEKRMRSQWEEDNISDRPDREAEERIWKKVAGKMGGQGIVRRLRIYKMIAVAASLMLLLGIGGMLYLENNREEQYMYVVASGVRCIEPVSLPDGTEVRMGANSQLTYPKYFNGKTRCVELKGQAFFNVAKDAEKPFIVHTNDMDVTALGTAFEIFNYDYENRVEAILLEGKVKVDLGSDSLANRQEVILVPNEMLAYDKQNHTVKVKTVNANNYSGWREGIMSFENERLSMILSRLEPWFGRKVKCSKEVAEKYRFTFKVRDESLGRILFMLSRTSPIRYKEVNGDYELYIKGDK